MIAIFIPKNEEELKKYKFATDFDKYFILDSLKSLSNYTEEKNRSDKPLTPRQQRLRKSNNQETLNLNYCFFKNEEDNLFVVIVETMPDKKEMVNAFKETFPEDDVNKYIKIFRSLADKITRKNTDLIEIVVFIHWGGGNPIKMENGFRENCLDLNCSSLRLFSISSRRSDKFNVNGSKIEVPKTKKELQAIINRFSFDKVKIFLTDYVVKINRKEKIEIKEQDVRLVSSYLSWIDERYRDSMVFDMDEKLIWKEVMNKVKSNPFLTIDAIRSDSSIKNKQEFINKIIHVYSRIIEEGMENV